MSAQATNGHEPMTLAVIGCGSMGSAILAGILNSSAKEEKPPISHFIACVQSQESVKRLNSSFSDYSDSPRENSCSFVRAMPNLAAQIGESITLISLGTTPISEKFTEISGWIFKQIGETSYIADNLYQAGAVLAGATPAWFTLALDGILDGAVSEGIKRGVAMEILAQSMLGTAKMIQSGEHPAILREKISSPKGTTIQGLKTLEKGGIRSSFTDAFIDSTQHGLNMK
ncbi:pyrroline-5-carboxylate reductase protein [Rutstroemia sp. NJR-2017a BVV2]|nr:pyrroline-5-carboxylate reductase protein [Rutstroemia sp. NJR-2017a BVV2]